MTVNSKQIIKKGKWQQDLTSVFPRIFLLLFLFIESMNIDRILQFGSNLMVPGRLRRCKEHFPLKKSVWAVYSGNHIFVTSQPSHNKWAHSWLQNNCLITYHSLMITSWGGIFLAWKSNTLSFVQYIDNTQSKHCKQAMKNITILLM